MPSPHRAIDLIDAQAIRISAGENGLFIDPLDDSDGRVAGVDLTAPQFQARLTRVKTKQDGELKAIGNYIARHGAPDLTENRPVALTLWLETAITKWHASRPFAAMIEVAAHGRTDEADTQPKVKEPSATPPIEAPSSPITTLTAEEIGLALTRQTKAAAQRADVTMVRLLNRKMWKNGKPTEMVRQFLIDLHTKPEYYARDRDGTLVCRQAGGRASAFALMMRDPVVADHARRYHEAGANSEPLPLPQWLGIDPRLPGHHHYSAAWIRTAQEEQCRLSVRLPALLASRPTLTMGPDDLIGVRDERLVNTAGADAVGLYDRTIQMRLRAAWLVQREEERDALAMIAAGDIKVALKREKASGALKLGSKNPAPPLPALFDPFLGDPAFIAQALAARPSGAPVRSRRPALLRAWDAAARELGDAPIKPPRAALTSKL